MNTRGGSESPLVRAIERSVAACFVVFAAVLVLATVGGGLRTCLSLRPPPLLTDGVALPNVTLPLSDDADLVLDTARLRGRVVLMTFWSSECASCPDSLRIADQYQELYGDRGFTVVTVNTESMVGALRSRRIARELAPSTLRVYDPYGATRYYFRTPGELRWILVSDAGNVLGFGASVAPSDHLVREALRVPTSVS
jgi:thiol-disulfide isomerase/thioredoxin